MHDVAAVLMLVTPGAAGAVLERLAAGRGFHSSTSQLNLSRV
jgi:hypothetical protein